MKKLFIAHVLAFAVILVLGISMYYKINRLEVMLNSQANAIALIANFLDQVTAQKEGPSSFAQFYQQVNAVK